MSILFAVTLAAVSTVQPSCSWDRPGVNPYTGKTAAAIDRYTDIPASVRSTLKRRMEEGQSDDKVTITRDGISGKSQYDPAIRDMHFGAASVCTTVTRGKWSEKRQEPGAVYCVDQHCILVPKICGNVSRITRLPAAAKAPAAAPPAAANLGDQMGAKDLGLADAEQHEPEELSEEALAERELRKLQVTDRASKLRRQPGGLETIKLNDEDVPELLADGGAFPLLPPLRDDSDGAIPLPVPEADTWAMLLAGLALLGVTARRRRSASRQG
ncbi:MHFG family PEP-CTERM protein [Duganella violaceipulchra]|uniref:MHFG family PEP-CTERM protein n=1 Tax=Duganella violaceipulchra TaxID=2849652 RepID=A0AA41H7G9_9BURK|nr:MHFG family PEP-CTERM protein [Duganella violaceicalia]MBV6319592.1 MHFG family PEP-CTERM protein [Duganella violaceicalia]MCP2006596.1 MYXO-CTERM domain-containing protein [Duganella violaceicalia]